MALIRLTLPDGTRLDARALLFDMDGVLVDSMATIERHLREWSELRGLDAEHVVATAPGRTNADLVALLTPHLDTRAEAERLARQEATDTEGMKACAGALETLDTLPKGTWAVVTSGHRAVAQARLGAAGLPIPDVMVTADDVRIGKPDPQGYSDAARQLGADPADCIVLEDAPSGIAAGRAAGMRTIEIRPVDATGAAAGGDHRVTDLGQLGVEVLAD